MVPIRTLVEHRKCFVHKMNLPVRDADFATAQVTELSSTYIKGPTC